ncbi:MAG: hypothetical protein EBR82_70225 [Caulobacteraceae bacterium]|nr:hypothetical protein [Caulobacteraceae bacterium]
MNKIIAYLNNENKVAWLVPMLEWTGTLEDIIQKDLGDKSYVVYNAEDFPSDFTFYNAWSLSNTGIVTDIPAAKAIWKDKWREARKSLLESLDIEFMKAVESGDTEKQSEIASKKQALRDVTKIEIAGNTPEEIKSIWPDILK